MRLARSFTERTAGFEESQVFRELGAAFDHSSGEGEHGFRGGDGPVELTRLSLGGGECVENQWIVAANFSAHQFRERHRLRSVAQGIIAASGQKKGSKKGSGGDS